jgi:MerR family transcriptional regulator, light-induced transcriptional regulator
MHPGRQGRIRIGELSRRLGVSADRLRTWEKRYELLQPERSEGGYRLYSPADERRVVLMQEQLARGLSPAEAARVAVVVDAMGAPAPAEGLQGLVAVLSAALERYDDSSAQAALDAMFAQFTVDAVIRDALMPYLRQVGESWECGDIGVDQEHYASNVIAGRLLGMARGWDLGPGARALLACPPQELHALGLISFGLALRSRGWRITYLGPDTPIDSLRRAAVALDPEAVVMSSVTALRFSPHLKELREVARDAPLCLAGAGATADLCERIGAELLEGDPVTAADRLHPRPV